MVTCAVSVHMEFLHNAGEVESTTTSRTRTDLEGKPEEDNSMLLKRRTGEGTYAAALQVLCAWLDWDCQTRVPHDSAHIRHTVPEVVTLEYASVVAGCAMLSPASGRQGA
jgi:hypothetical protein